MFFAKINVYSVIYGHIYCVKKITSIGQVQVVQILILE